MQRKEASNQLQKVMLHNIFYTETEWLYLSMDDGVVDKPCDTVKKTRLSENSMIVFARRRKIFSRLLRSRRDTAYCPFKTGQDKRRALRAESLPLHLP